MDKDDGMMSQKEIRDSELIISDLQALKELERARLGDRILEKNKLGVVNIDEETKAKNDLISRELRNIKRGMLSMRGNTSAKREILSNKEKEQSKQEAFTKLDGNVIVNKALINDNYDKAKMALEEIISERQRKKSKTTEQDANPDENVSDESFGTRLQERQTTRKEYVTEVMEKHNDNTFTLTDVRERLGDLRDHNHLRQILSQTEPRLGETHRAGGWIALPGMDKTSNELNTLLKTKAKYVNYKLTDSPSYVCDNSADNLRQIARQVSEESQEYLMNETDGKKLNTPPVPPRSRKGGSRRDSNFTMEKDVVDENDFNKYENDENCDTCLNEMRTDSETHKVDSEKALLMQSQISSDKDKWDETNVAISKSLTVTDALRHEPISTSNFKPSEFRENDNMSSNVQTYSPTREATFENSSAQAKETSKIKRKAPSKPDHLFTPDDNVTKGLVAEKEVDKIDRPSEDVNLDAVTLSETPRHIISPLLLVNGVNINQSPPDQASLSSKSSYFSVESALHRNTESETNVYHSLENLLAEVEEIDEAMQNVSRNTLPDSDRTELEYYSLSDHESEPEVVKRPIKSPQKDTNVLKKVTKESDNTTTDPSLSHDDNNSTTMSPSNTFSPTLGIPALFKVKDNTFSNKLIKTVQPWSPRGSLNGSERGEEEAHQVKENTELPLVIETPTSSSTLIPAEIFKPEEISVNQSPPLLLSPSNLQNENLKTPQDECFLTVPQEEDRFSGVSPSSEGVESLPTSTGDTADEMTMNAGGLVERQVTKLPSECSGSTCSGNDSQTGLPKPPAVLPKSEKAVLKAMKLANRRMKKEEAQKSTHKSSQSSSSKHRSERHKNERSEHKSSSSSKTSRSSEKKHREKTDGGQSHNENHQSKNSNDQNEQLPSNNGSHHHHNRTEMRYKTRRQSYDSVDSREAPSSVTSERQGRSSDRHVRDKPEQRHYSSDRVFSNVPVYKAHVSERPMSDRPFQRSQSIDRYLGDKVERRLSADTSVSEKLDPRTQRIEKSIMDELQQRGRARDKASRDNLLRRSHSIDAYSTEVPHPSPLSRQSSHTSHTSQLSRQSSIEHTIVTQSFPMTQRKLLQDPDSGQYFFVDMPVQVKTKTFFDPETGSYVQLPVQPPEGAVPQPSPMEVLTPPMVVYHGFVPVPLSPMARKTTIQAPHMKPDEFEQRHLERSRQMLCKEGHPYLEPVYGQHDHMLGEFMGTEELDCPS
uniref:DUF4585 domain-containing protein n=1 Tax=Acanthochromis polyacanthus TaxID=80966 RepID=A0A3Q1G823_9TELE